MPGSAGGNWSIYEGEKEDGAGDRSRTYDLRITNALLYQLSYTGVRAGIIEAMNLGYQGESEILPHIETVQPGARPLRVLVISRNLPPLTGGMERLVANAVVELARRHRVTVIGPAGCSQSLPAGITVHDSFGHSALAYLLCALPLALLAALRERPDVIVAGSGLTAPIARLVAALWRSPYAVMIHGLDVIVAHRGYQAVFVPCLRSADALIANSEHTAQLALNASFPAKKVSVLHPGVEFPPPTRRGFRELFGIREEHPLLLSVGRVVRRKGLAAFISRVMPVLLQHFPDLRLAVIGDEPASSLVENRGEMTRIREAIARLGLHGHVILCGRVTDDVLHAAYAEADAQVFPVLEIPGDVEGFGMVAVEAAAHGLPTFGFRSGGVQDAVVGGKTGELVENGDYAALGEHLVRYLTARTRQPYRAECLRHAEAHSWSRYGKRLSEMLDIAVAGRSTRPSGRRAYQYGYSSLHPEVNDPVSRERKSATAIAVIEHYLGRSVSSLRVADVGGSGGVMAARFAREGAAVTVIDIDEAAIVAARERYRDIANLEFRIGDAMAIEFADASFDIVLCCHVYEHVPDAARMMREIRRVLRPGGLCYFTAGNRFTWREPHYGLPLLSVVPPVLAHRYLRLMGRGDFYHERHLGYGGLRRLTATLQLHDYTHLIVNEPQRYAASYMIRPGSLLQRAAAFVLRLAPQVFPNFIWLLKKPGAASHGAWEAESADARATPTKAMQ